MEPTISRENLAPKRNYPYQNAAIRETLEEFKRGVTSTALIMATGTGKTFVFSQIAKEFIRQYQKPVLILAHRIELVEQIERTLLELNIRSVREQAGAFAMSGGAFDAVVACTKTLAKPERLAQFDHDAFCLLITDECHHAPCAENRRIYDHFSGIKHLGVTATPLRHDRIGLKNIYQTVSFQYPIQRGIEERFLCPIRGKRIKVEGLTLEEIKTSKNDFSKGEIDDLLTQDKMVQRMVLPTLDHAEDRQTIVFTQSLEHARRITSCFNREAGKEIAVNVDSTLDDKTRRDAINQYRDGGVQFVVNVGVLTEGFDDPPTSCIALFRPTKSVGLLAQMIGRGTRIFEDKRDCLVLDFVGIGNDVRTASVFDVLDGTLLSDQEHDIAHAYLAAGDSATVALQKAKTDAAKLTALEIRWKALSSSNPFDIMKLFALPSSKGLYGGGLCTFAQRGVLENAGLRVPATMEKGEASGLIAEIIRRRNAGLATLKQLRFLKSLGVTAFEVDVLTFQDAGKLIGATLSAKQSPSWARV